MTPFTLIDVNGDVGIETIQRICSLEGVLSTRIKPPSGD
jgi:hypothetical protein